VATHRAPAQRTASETREHVLEVAHDLFYWHGIRATGVDKIAAEAGVAPTTLYRLFASKDDLVAAYVARASALYQGWFNEASEAGGADPRQRILALFDALAEQVQPDRCRGCPFLMALTEFPDASLAAHQHAVTTKSWVRGRLGELTEELSRNTQISDPGALADQLALMIEGVYASAQALGADGPAIRARELAEMLLGAGRTP
jgi:AcrR family transcriptional regulator